MERSQLSTSGSGSKDGSGAADNDQPYQFGRRPRALAPWPFTERQYAHLLVLRGRLADAPDPADRMAPAKARARSTAARAARRASATSSTASPTAAKPNRRRAA
jgi:hypothetical protein